jgi:hypothetical protein
MCENHALRFNFTGRLLATGFQQTRSPRPQSLALRVGFGSDNDLRPTSAQFLKAFEDEDFARVSLRWGLVLLQVFAVTARAFEPN